VTCSTPKSRTTPVAKLERDRTLLGGQGTDPHRTPGGRSDF
jgi:hypothetical protein